MGSILYFVLLVILAYPIAKFIVYAKLEHEEQKKKSSVSKTEKNDMPAFKEAIRTYQISNYITACIKTKTKIKSELIIFEEIFFFSFLEKFSFSIIKVPDSVKKKYFPMLKETLQHESPEEYARYKDKFETLSDFRALMYWKLMRKYSKKITTAFLQDAIRYQAELINYIVIFDELMEEKKEPLSYQDWNEKTERFENLRLLENVLNNNLDLVKNFLPKEVLDN